MISSSRAITFCGVMRDWSCSINSSSDIEASGFVVMAPSIIRTDSSRILESGGPAPRLGGATEGSEAPNVSSPPAVGSALPRTGVGRAGVARNEAAAGGVGTDRVGCGGVSDPNAGIARNGVAVLAVGAATRGEELGVMPPVRTNPLRPRWTSTMVVPSFSNRSSNAAPSSLGRASPARIRATPRTSLRGVFTGKSIWCAECADMRITSSCSCTASLDCPSSSRSTFSWLVVSEASPLAQTRHGGSQHLLVLPRPRGIVGKEIHELGEPSGKRGCATRHARADHPESGDFFPCMTLDMPWRILTTPPPSVFSRPYAARNIPSRSTLCPAFT